MEANKATASSANDKSVSFPPDSNNHASSETLPSCHTTPIPDEPHSEGVTVAEHKGDAASVAKSSIDNPPDDDAVKPNTVLAPTPVRAGHPLRNIPKDHEVYITRIIQHKGHWLVGYMSMDGTDKLYYVHELLECELRAFMYSDITVKAGAKVPAFLVIEIMQVMVFDIHRWHQQSISSLTVYHAYAEAIAAFFSEHRGRRDIRRGRAPDSLPARDRRLDELDVLLTGTSLSHQDIDARVLDADADADALDAKFVAHLETLQALSGIDSEDNFSPPLQLAFTLSCVNYGLAQDLGAQERKHGRDRAMLRATEKPFYLDVADGQVFDRLNDGLMKRAGPSPRVRPPSPSVELLRLMVNVAGASHPVYGDYTDRDFPFVPGFIITPEMLPGSRWDPALPHVLLWKDAETMAAHPSRVFLDPVLVTKVDAKRKRESSPVQQQKQAGCKNGRQRKKKRQARNRKSGKVESEGADLSGSA